MSTTEANAFTQWFNETLAKITDPNSREGFISAITRMADDPTSRGGWNSVMELLKNYGIDITGVMGLTADALDARYSSKELSTMGVSQELINQYLQASGEDVNKFHRSFEEWEKDYETMSNAEAKTRHELLERVIDAIVENYEKQIDAYEETAEAIEQANSDLISQLSNKIQEDRQKRDDEETRAELTDSRNRLAYLMADTSGGNALEILKLQKDTQKAEQEYQDSLVDQAINKLEDANAKAAEQRERQIELARQQLQAYKNSDAIVSYAQKLIEDAAAQLGIGDIKNTELGKLLSQEGFISEYQSLHIKLFFKLNQVLAKTK